MAERKTPEIIIVRERALESWLRDLSSFACFVALIGIGVLLDSNAMQWVGAILGFIVIIGRANRLMKENRLSIADARKRLDEIEAASE